MIPEQNSPNIQWGYSLHVRNNIYTLAYFFGFARTQNRAALWRKLARVQEIERPRCRVILDMLGITPLYCVKKSLPPWNLAGHFKQILISENFIQVKVSRSIEVHLSKNQSQLVGCYPEADLCVIVINLLTLLAGEPTREGVIIFLCSGASDWELE